MTSNEPIGDRIAATIGRWLSSAVDAFRSRPTPPLFADEEPIAQLTGEGEQAPPKAPSAKAPAPVASDADDERMQELIAASTRPAQHQTCELLMMLSGDYITTLRPALVSLVEHPEDPEHAAMVFSEVHNCSASGIRHLLDHQEGLEAGGPQQVQAAETLRPLIALMRDTYVQMLRIRTVEQIRPAQLATMDDLATAIAGSPKLQRLMDEARLTEQTSTTI